MLKKLCFSIYYLVNNDTLNIKKLKHISSNFGILYRSHLVILFFYLRLSLVIMLIINFNNAINRDFKSYQKLKSYQ